MEIFPLGLKSIFFLVGSLTNVEDTRNVEHNSPCRVLWGIILLLIVGLFTLGYGFLNLVFALCSMIINLKIYARQRLIHLERGVLQEFGLHYRYPLRLFYWMKNDVYLLMPLNLWICLVQVDSKNCNTIVTGMEFGFCGCLSTVSTFIAEFNAMRESRHPWRAYAYAMLTISISFALGTLIYSIPVWTKGYN